MPTVSVVSAGRDQRHHINVLRGASALVVMLVHIYMVISAHRDIHGVAGYRAVVVAAQMAVRCFFVLSGYLLIDS